VQESGSSGRDAPEQIEQLGRFVRDAFFAVRAFLDALLDSAAWERFGRRVFKRIVIIGIVGIGFAGLGWKYSTGIFLWLLVPAKGNLTPFADGLPVFTAPAEMFGVTVSLAFRIGVLAAIPAIVISVYTLSSQWLPSRTRTFIKIFVPSIFLAFAGGVAFVYYVILPTSLTFLLGFGKGVAVPLISVTHYFDMVLSLMFWVGVLFELPLAMYLLARLGLVSYRKLKRARLAVWFFAPVLAAIITPSFDAYTWTLITVPLVILYDAGLFLSWLARPGDQDYMAVRKTGSAIARLARLPRRACRKAAGAVTTVFRWILRK